MGIDRRTPLSSARQRRPAALALLACLGWSCAVPRPAVPLRLDAQLAPADARVFIDERYVGPLHWVAARGVRLPKGAHRISVRREGYFPWDRLVEAARKPVQVRIVMDQVPD